MTKNYIPCFSQILLLLTFYLICLSVYLSLSVCLSRHFHVICRHVQRGKKFQSPSVHMFPAEMKQGSECSVFLFEFSYCKQVSLLQFMECHIFTVLCTLLMILLFKMALMHSAEVPSNAPNLKKAVSLFYLFLFYSINFY